LYLSVSLALQFINIKYINKIIKNKIIIIRGERERREEREREREREEREDCVFMYTSILV
jgi:hypothetical protein